MLTIISLKKKEKRSGTLHVPAISGARQLALCTVEVCNPVFHFSYVIFSTKAITGLSDTTNCKVECSHTDKTFVWLHKSLEK